MELIIVGIVIWAVWAWMRETRLERQKQKFEDFQKKVASQQSEKRSQELLQTQRENMKELASFTLEYLNKYQRDIPPRVFDELKINIAGYVENVVFDKLYEIHNLLKDANKKTVYAKIQTFRR